MQKIVCILILLFLNLNATTIVSQNTNKLKDSIKISLAFNDKFNGELFLTEKLNSLNILLKGVDTNERFVSKINSDIIRNFIIHNVDEGVEINIYSDNKLTMNAVLSQNNKILNMTFSKKNIAIEQSKKHKNKSIEKNKFNFKFIYLIIGVLLIILILIFSYFKFKNSKETTELFSEFENDIADEIEKIDEEKTVQIKTEEPKENLEPKIIYKKKISQDKVLLLIEQDSKAYLIFLSEDNKIPDKSYKQMLEHEEKFQEFLEICKHGAE